MGKSPFFQSTLNYSQCKLCDKLLLIVRKCILIDWITDKPSSVTLWCRELFKVIPHERTAAVLGGNEDLFLNAWFPLLIYLLNDLSQLLRGGWLLLRRPQVNRK